LSASRCRPVSRASSRSSNAWPSFVWRFIWHRIGPRVAFTRLKNPSLLPLTRGRLHFLQDNRWTLCLGSFRKRFPVHRVFPFAHCWTGMGGTLRRCTGREIHAKMAVI
jgi:hypothetical protein